MKTKLTLNIDHKVIEKAKKFTSRKNVSLSSVVENYLAGLSAHHTSPKKELPEENTITQRIRKLTKPIKISDTEIKKQWARHLEEKYGK